MNVESGQPPATGDPKDSGRDGDKGPSAVYILMVLTVTALACVGGYFFSLKLVDMSRQEDCLMSGRRNCAPIEVPSNR
jgi:hypothetical protein